MLFHPRAKRELEELYDYVADQGGPQQAANFIGKIRDYCLGFSTFPERGQRRDDIEPGVRVVGYRRRVSIVFSVGDKDVWILGIYYGGRNLDISNFDDEAEPEA